MIEFLQYGFMQRSLLAGIIVAVLCSVIGNFLVMRRMALIGDGLAHVAFGGLTVGLVVGVYPLWTALGASILGVLAINELRCRARIYGDTAIGVLFSAGLAVGAVVLSVKRGFGIDIFSFLFGSLLTVSAADVLMILILSVIVLCVIGVLYKELLFVAFDEESAKASGIPVKVLDVVLLCATAIAVVSAMQIVGILLVSSLLIIPVASALQFSHGFKGTLFYSVVISVLSVILGLFSSFYLDIAAGGSIVLVTILFFIVSFLFRKFLSSFGLKSYRV